MNKMVLCRWIARKGSPPRLVALLPQPEQVDDIGTQIKAPGFNMIILPFSDDIRHLRFEDDDEEGTKKIATHDQIDKAKSLVSKLNLPGKYDPDSYDNPVLQKHYANLQALALDQELEGNLEDCTMPAYDRIKLRAETQINEFKEAIGWQVIDDNGGDFASSSKATSKRPKQPTSEDYDCVSAISAIKTDPSALAKFTVADLKTYLDSIEVKPKRVKAEIIEQIVGMN